MQLDQRSKSVVVSITHLTQFARSRDLHLFCAYETRMCDVCSCSWLGNLLHLPSCIAHVVALGRVALMIRKFPPFITAATFLARQTYQERRRNSRAPLLFCLELRHGPHCMLLRTHSATEGVRSPGIVESYFLIWL
jgi:hypothetical protein